VKLLVAQGGGPTAVINQSLVGAVLAARAFPQLQAVLGARHGVRGVLQEDFVDLTGEDINHLERVAATPASALGSTRDKPDPAYCLQMLAVIKAHGITHFFYIGGNDSSDTVRILMEQAARSGHPLAGVHIPKTIDNDLMGNDHTPGYPSAAKFVAQAFAGADLDNAALPGVYVAVVMGRHAGFLTAASALVWPSSPNSRNAAAAWWSVTRMAMCSFLAPVRWPTCCVTRSRPDWASSAYAGTPLATCSAAS
jgi:6-phosphofructokinase 1